MRETSNYMWLCLLLRIDVLHPVQFFFVIDHSIDGLRRHLARNAQTTQHAVVLDTSLCDPEHQDKLIDSPGAFNLWSKLPTCQKNKKTWRFDSVVWLAAVCCTESARGPGRRRILRILSHLLVWLNWTSSFECRKRETFLNGPGRVPSCQQCGAR